MNHAHQSHAEFDNYKILFCTNNQNNRHENPVRDYQEPLFEKEEKYKDFYGVSNFKFPEVTTTVFRTNNSNFCELSFDGTKSSKHHHRRKNTIKRVASATTINCTAKKHVSINEEKGPSDEDEEVEKNKDTTTFHHLAEQFKKKLKFIESPIKLHKNVVTKQKGGTLEVILSPKTPNSFSSIEAMAMSNILQSSDHRLHKQIFVASKTFHPSSPNKPDMRDREIQTAIIGIRNINNMDDCLNMNLASVNNIFYNMDLLPITNEDLSNLKQRKKRRKLNLTITHFPCVEIKCSSMIFEMPAASSQRPRMPRRTINTNNNSVATDEPATVNSSEATDNLKDKIFNLFNDTQIASGDDYTRKLNDLCALISSLLTERKSRRDKHIRNSVQIPSEMFIDIGKLKASEAANRQNSLIIPSYSSPQTFKKHNMCRRSSSNPSTPTPTPQNRSRSVSPPSQPSTPREMPKIPIAESKTRTSPRRSESCESRSKKRCFDTSGNTSTAMQNRNSKFSFTSIPSVSTLSSGSRNIRMALDDETDETIQIPQAQPEKLETLPRNVFVIPPHVNEILKKCEYNTLSHLRNKFGVEGYKCPSANSNTKPSDFQLVNILKKTPIKQSWVVPDLTSKSQPKCDSINNFQCAKNTKTTKRTNHDFGGPSVTFNSMVDVFGGDNESLEERMCSTPNPKTLQNTIVPVTGLKKSKTYPNKPELYAMSEREEKIYQNSSLFTARQTENKPKLNFEKQASFYNSGLLTTKKETTATTSCLQKRKDYDNKLKMQLQMQNKQTSKIPLPTKVVEQDNKAVKNETSKAVSSKLPVRITNNKQVQEFSKLFTTDIKNTPFSKLKCENTPRKQESQLSTPRLTSSIRKSTQKNIDNNLNVTKDVSNTINPDKEIIFIKHPKPSFHKTRYKFEVDPKNLDNNLLRQKYNNNQNIISNHSNTSNLKKYIFPFDPAHATPLEFNRLQHKNMKRENSMVQQKSFCPHQNVIFVYRNKEKLFSNVFKKDSLTKRKKTIKKMRKDEKKNRSFPKICEEKLNIVKSVKFKNSLIKMKPKINKVTFLEPKKWASLCKIQQCNTCKCKEKQSASEKNEPVEAKNKHKLGSTKNLPEVSKDNIHEESNKSSPQLDYSNIIKSCCDKFISACGICNKQKEMTSTPTTSFKQMADNLMACCTTLCCKVDKNTLKNSTESIPKSKPFQRKLKYHQTHWLYVKPPKMQKVYRRCNTCLISTSKSFLLNRKKSNPAWKFKELVYNKVPYDLNNIIKNIKNKTFNNFLHLPVNEKQNSLFDLNNGTNAVNGDKKQLTKIFPVCKNPQDTAKFSTISLGDTTEKIPNSLRNIKVVNKGRFSKKIKDDIKCNQTPRNIKFAKKNVPSFSKKIEGTIFIPTSPRKIILSGKTASTSSRKHNEDKEEFLLFPSYKEDTINHVSTSPKTIEHLKQNVPTFPFPWIRNISTSSKNVEEDLRQNITNTEKQNNTEETLRKNKLEDRPIMIFIPKELDDTKKNKNTTLPRKNLKDIPAVIYDSGTRKIYENKPKVLISPRQINTDILSTRKVDNDTRKIHTTLESNEVIDSLNKLKENNNLEFVNLCDNQSTANIQINPKEKHSFKTTKLPVLKTRRDINTKLLTPKKKVDIKTKTEEKHSLLKKKSARRFTIARKRQISKLVIETNEVVHISDDDLIIPLKSKESRESKSTEYKSIAAHSGFSSNSQLTISSNSKKAPSTSKTFFSVIGNFFRKYTKKVRKKKSKSMDENG